MKKQILMLSAAVALTLTACGSKEAEDETVPSDQPVPTHVAVTQAPIAETVPPVETEAVMPPVESEAVPTPEPTEAPEELDPLSTPEASIPRGIGVPTDEEVLSKYREANEAYSWFAVCTLPGDPNDSKTIDDFLYTRVADERFPTMSSFRAYLKTLFSDEIVDSLLPYDGKQYMEIDGALYVSEGARGADTSKGGITLMVLWPEGEDPTSCTVQATVELLNWADESSEPFVSGEQTYEFPYQKVGEKWVFTQFESII